MKLYFKFLLTSIFVSLSVSLFSQNFITENKVWSIVAEGGMEQPWTRTTSYKFSGDSTIQNSYYKKLYSSEDEQKANWTLHSLWFERNDSVFKHLFETEENLLIYDFNITEKDSFLNSNTGLYLYVDSVRAKEWGISERELFYFHSKENSYIHPVWIKGVGQNGDITNSSEVGITGGFSSILCFEENGQPVYQNTKYNSCYIFTSLPTIKKEPNLVEVHNTCENLITVNPLSNSPGIIEVYNISGRKIIQKEIDITEIKMTLPSKGIYIYRVTIQTGEMQTGKIIVK